MMGSLRSVGGSWVRSKVRMVMMKPAKTAAMPFMFDTRLR